MARQPNVVFVIVDDQRFDTIAALGHPQVKTPNLDALAQRGTAMTEAHLMGSMSGAVCAPSRAMLHTGRTLWHTNQPQCFDINDDHVFMPQWFGQQGYHTFGTGKWHNGKASFARSFRDGAKIFLGGMSGQFNMPLHDFDPTGEYTKENRYRSDGQHATDVFTDAACEFIGNYNGDKPYFLYCAYTSPHDPRSTHQRFHDMYPPDKIELPPNFLPNHPFDNGELKIRDEELAEFPRTEKEIRQHISDYYAMITHHDEAVGRIVAAVEARGELDNTIFVFTADHGLAVGQHGLMGKQNMYEHSMHIPMLMAGPGIPSHAKRDQLVYLLDMFPTLCDLCGLATPNSVEGVSMKPILDDEDADGRHHLSFAYTSIQRAIRDKRHKLIEYVVNGERHTQLFDLVEDPWEMTNHANMPNSREHIERLRTLLVEERDALDDDWEEHGAVFWAGY